MVWIWLEAYKPAIAMVVAQFIYAGVSLFTRAALIQGMSPKVFVVYRQAIATIVIAPIAYFSRRQETRSSLTLKSFSLLFLAALIGATGTQNTYFEGLYLASSSVSVATTNLIPAVTFLMAAVAGLEKVSFQSFRSVAKVAGTGICVGGAVCMAIIKGPKLLNTEIQPTSLFSSDGQNWVLGCLLLFASCCCWSLWLILQVPISECYPDHLSSSAWMCFFSTIQSGTLTLFLERDPEAWIVEPNIELASCFYSGVIGSGVAFFLQAWSVSQKGPLFSAMFYPLCTVIVTILASLFLHEEIYTGSLIGAIAVIIGLYVVLWGKAGDLGGIQKEQQTSKQQNDHPSSHLDLEEPLLSDKSTTIDKRGMKL